MTEFETRRLSRNDGFLSSPEESFERTEQSFDGDTALDAVLEKLEAGGATVFHDVPGDGFSLDHVVIHPTGVYPIETGVTPGRDGTVVNFDGAAISLDGAEHSDAPISRAKAAGAWLGNLLQAATGRPVVIRPTLVFPRGFVESEQALDADMLVINPGALPRFMANARPVLSRQDVMLVAYHLSRYMASGEPR